ncbi:cation:proton antiporter [Patescibacteria group bacterium]|nr:cation:proton antiporter [Patescibacteria group bacterium]
MLPPLILQIAIIISVAFVGGMIAHKLRLPVIVGYLFAGAVFGALFSARIENPEFVNFFSEIGIALLLFTLGIEFNLDHLKVVGKPAVLGALAQIAIVATVGFFLFPVVLGISYLQALFLSLAISLTSTAVVAKALYDRGETNSIYGELSLGWLVVQDLAVLPIMVLLTLFSGKIGVWEILIPIAKAGFLFYLTLIFGRKTIPYLFKKLAIASSNELLLLVSFAFALLFASFAYELGLPFAVGAFLAGVILSTATVNHEVFAQIRPVRDLFACLFFVSIGYFASSNFNPSSVGAIIILLIFVLVIKVLTVFLLCLNFKLHTKVAFLTACAMFGVGEFSFILGRIALDEQIFDNRIFNILTMVVVLSMALTPIMMSVAYKMYLYLLKFLKRYSPKIYQKVVAGHDSEVSFPKKDQENLRDHIIIVGYGRVGRQVAFILDLAQMPFVVIDYHLPHLKDLKSKGKPFVYGDATNEEILIASGIKSCTAVLVAVPDVNDSEAILGHCLRLNSTAKFIARAHKDKDAARLKIRGVSRVVEPEFEASISLARHALYFLDFELEKVESLLAKARKGYRY